MRLYEKASRQRINLDKSTVSFSPNVPKATKAKLCSILGMTNSKLAEKYLGVLAIMGRNKRQFSNISKKKFGGDYVDGIENAYLEGKKKFS